MSTPPIHRWTDAYLATKRRLEELRGVDEVESETGTERWPRSTGYDVIAIAAMLDQPLRAAPTTYGTERVLRRWYDCLDAIETLAWPAPADLYAENRAFWSCALVVCVHLDADGVPPDESAFWEAFLLQFEAGAPHRNVDQSPFVTIDGIKSYDDMYIAQWKYLRDLRGADVMPPPTEMVAGMSAGGDSVAIPRTTNSDVLQLATYWTHAFANARSVLDDHDAVAAQWQVVLADVDKLAKNADPSAVYAKNNVFWRVIDSVSSECTASDHAPTRWDLFVGALQHSITHLPENLVKEAEWVGSKAKSVFVGAADTIGDAAGKVVKGVFGGISTPILIGGGALAAFLLLRRGGNEEASHA